MQVNQPKEGGAELNPAGTPKPEIRERPILFNGAMVRAILDGRKMVTRRQINPQFPSSVNEVLPYATYRGAWMPRDPESPDDAWEEQVRVCPYGKPGDRLWVRETWQLHEKFTDTCVVVYKANERNSWTEFHRRFPVSVARGAAEKPFQTHGFRPSIHMPRWACRILLEITDVRVERLQDITYEQAAAEGIHRHNRMWSATDEGGACHKYPEPAFRDLWLSTGGDWDANPWVWVVEFKRVEVADAR